MIFKCTPTLRTASSEDTTGYTWGKPWNDSYIKNTLHKHSLPSTPDILAERWIVSDDPREGSKVNYYGQLFPLATLLNVMKDKILGITHYKKHGPHLGIVMKIIDTHNHPQKGSLSVQVHPAPGHPTLPAKPEVWYGTGSFYVGTKERYTDAELHEFYKNGSLEQHMDCITFETRQRIIILGGMLHAIRAGSTLYEWSYSPTQAESSQGSLRDATIGFYDRTDGKTPRPGKEEPERALEVMRHAALQGGSMLIDDVRILFQDQHNIQKQLFSVEGIMVEELHLSKPYVLTKNEARSFYIEEGEVFFQEEGYSRGSYYVQGEEGLIDISTHQIIIIPQTPSLRMFMYYRK